MVQLLLMIVLSFIFLNLYQWILDKFQDTLLLLVSKELYELQIPKVKKKNLTLRGHV